MTDRPIIFSAPMVRAIVAGTKTQTRRVQRVRVTAEGMTTRHPCHVGDRLWVRETCGYVPMQGVRERCRPWCPVPAEMNRALVYRADGEIDGLRWLPSIHMPRWASRITLAVDEVRVERLQAISDADIDAEGLDMEDNPDFDAAEHAQIGGAAIQGGTPERFAFAAAWDRINGKHAPWDLNPWVWVVRFHVEEVQR